MPRSVVFVSFCLLLSSVARADEPASAAFVPSGSPAPTSTHDLPYVSVRYNPLALAVDRISGDIEAWPTDHVSIVATPWIVNYSQSAQEIDTAGTTFMKLHLAGVEVGVRYWPTVLHVSWGTIAPFVGAIAGGAWGKLDTSYEGDRYGPTGPFSNTVSLQQVIVGGEGGVAFIARPFILEVGAGLQFTQPLGTDPRGPVGWDCWFISCIDTMHLRYGFGLDPRVLLSAGFAL